MSESTGTAIQARTRTLVTRVRARLVENPQLAFTAVIAVAIWTYFTYTVVGYATTDNVFAVLHLAAPLGLVALGLTVAIIAGEIDLSVGSMAALIGVVVVRLSTEIGPLPALIAGVAIAAALGALQGLAIAWLRISSIVFTVGTLMLLRGVALLVSQHRTVVVEDFGFGSFLRTRWGLVSPTVLLALAVFISLGVFLRYHKWGREIYAIGGARNEALAAGVNVTRPLMIVFTTTAACAGLAGGLVALQSGSAQPLGLQAFLLLGTAAAFVGGAGLTGGKGSAFGAAFGTITLQLLTNGLNLRATPEYIAEIYWGGLLLGVVLVVLAAEAFDRSQVRKALLRRMDQRRAELAERRPDRDARPAGVARSSIRRSVRHS